MSWVSESLLKVTVVQLLHYDHNLTVNERKGFSHRRQGNKPVKQPEWRPKMKNHSIEHGFLKSTLLLTTLIFLSVAPEPDSRDIAEMSSNFIVSAKHSALMASSEPVKAAEKELHSENR